MKTQADFFYHAHRMIADKDKLFIEMRNHPTDPLTDEDLAKLIEKNPATWGRYEAYLKNKHPLLPGFGETKMSVTKQEKTTFVENLAKNVAAKLVEAINADAIPEEWEGVELRWILERLFKEAARGTMRQPARKAAFTKKIYRINHNHDTDL